MPSAANPNPYLLTVSATTRVKMHFRSGRCVVLSPDLSVKLIRDCGTTGPRTARFDSGGAQARFARKQRGWLLLEEVRSLQQFGRLPFSLY